MFSYRFHVAYKNIWLFCNGKTTCALNLILQNCDHVSFCNIIIAELSSPQWYRITKIKASDLQDAFSKGYKMHHVTVPLHLFLFAVRYNKLTSGGNIFCHGKNLVEIGWPLATFTITCSLATLLSIHNWKLVLKCYYGIMPNFKPVFTLPLDSIFLIFSILKPLPHSRPMLKQSLHNIFTTKFYSWSHSWLKNNAFLLWGHWLP